MSTYRRQFCTFVVEGLYFGVDVDEVQEVIRYQDMTRVPLATDKVRGLINLRGQIVPAIDLRQRMGFGAAEGLLPMNVVLRRDDGAVSLLVDEIGEVVDVDASSFEQPPPTLRGRMRELVTGIYKLPSRLLLVLDTARAIADRPVAVRG